MRISSSLPKTRHHKTKFNFGGAKIVANLKLNAIQTSGVVRDEVHQFLESPQSRKTVAFMNKTLEGDIFWKKCSSHSKRAFKIGVRSNRNPRPGTAYFDYVNKKKLEERESVKGEAQEVEKLDKWKYEKNDKVIRGDINLKQRNVDDKEILSLLEKKNIGLQQQTNTTLEILGFFTKKEKEFVSTEKEKTIKARNIAVGIHSKKGKDTENRVDFFGDNTNATQTMESMIAKVNKSFLDNILINKIIREQFEIEDYLINKDYISTRIKQMAAEIISNFSSLTSMPTSYRRVKVEEIITKFWVDKKVSEQLELSKAAPPKTRPQLLNGMLKQENSLHSILAEYHLQVEAKSKEVALLKIARIESSNNCTFLTINKENIKRKCQSRLDFIEVELAKNLVGASKAKAELLKYKVQMTISEIEGKMQSEVGVINLKILEMERTMENDDEIIRAKNNEIEEIRLGILICSFALKDIYKEWLSNIDNIM